MLFRFQEKIFRFFNSPSGNPVGNTNLRYPFHSCPWIFGIAQSTVDDYEVRFFHVQRCYAATLLPIIWKHVYPGTTICSDQWKAYRRLQTMYGYDHQTVKPFTKFHRAKHRLPHSTN